MDSLDPKSSDQLQKLRQSVEQATLPSDLKQSVLERIERLELYKSSPSLGSAFGIELDTTVTYIHWITRLPWEQMTQDTLDIAKAAQILDQYHYGLASVKNRILEYLASIILNAKNHDLGMIHAPILCLVGLAGSGKTTLGSSIAQALGRKFERIPFGGMGDARVLRGQSRLLPEAEPGQIIRKLISAKSKNCVILLDELDRVAEGTRFDIMGVLLELLDPEQNRAFTDHYIDYPFDLSQVLFIATANNTANISTAVLDRLEIIQMPSFTDQEKTVIGKSYLFPKVRLQTGLMEYQLRIDDAVWPTIIRPLGFDSGIRSLEHTIEGICRKVARLVVEGKTQTVQIDVTNVKEYLPI